ncbi:MAG: sugar kinase [Bacteroidales bacterium]|nr:sugar kinase [Bacteroidales bacterium]
MISFKNDCRYDLLVPTSMGLRLSPVGGHPVHAGGLFTLQATSAESNVASVSAALGLSVKVLTKWVDGSPLARFIESDLRGRGIEVEGPRVEQGGPWGYRHQFNIADSGSGLRGPRVWNDRAGEVGQTLSVQDFDLERILGKEGVRLIHLSGLIAALSPQTGEFCRELARAAHHHGTRISFDLNYRASFWKGREKELREIFSEIASLSDILIGNEEDFQLCLGVAGPEAGGKDLGGKTEAFLEMMGRVREQYPRSGLTATTLREVKDSNCHLWGALVVENEGAEDAKTPSVHSIAPREIHVLDRIGGGDGFVGGLLYGLLKGWEVERCARFGWASGVLAVNGPTDYAMPADEEQIWSIWKGNARVKR